MDACDVDGHKAASLIYPSSLLPTAFCIGFHGNPLSRMISSHRSYRQIFFSICITQWFMKQAGRQQGERRGEVWRGVTRAGSFPGVCTFPVFKTSEAMGLQQITRFCCFCLFPLSLFHVLCLCVECTCVQVKGWEWHWVLTCLLPLIQWGEFSNWLRLACKARLALQSLF